MNFEDVYNFWFKEIETKMWYTKSDEFDQTLRDKFLETHELAREGQLTSWRDSAIGSLSEIIVLDQFSRNMFRDSAEAFAYDELALNCSKLAIEQGFNKELEGAERNFLYMPFMHSESKEVHEVAMKYFSEPGMAYDYEVKHKAIIDRFGRYPHRNEVLGRESTPEEIEFLKGPNSSF